jgi:hypothetical protein
VKRRNRKNTEASAAFRPGSGGVCEAQLWKFSAPENPYNREEEPESELVAAESIHEALKYVRRRHGDDFRISKAECLGMIALLSGSPLD